MKKSIVITSIFEPTKAVKAFAQLNEYDLIVIGDKKSPEQWHCDHTTYLSVQDQINSGFRIVNELPYNHYSRKMIGYLVAIQRASDYIIDTDDDNIPKPGWGFPPFNAAYDCVPENKGFVNIYQHFTGQKIWPRGLPLNLINTEFKFHELVSFRECRVGIWQGLADNDPDVDAVYRLTNNTPCTFDERKPIVLSRGTVCPFNSQNTILCKDLFPLLYLPTSVTSRFTDILRSLIAQPILWLYNFQLGFTNATVIQKRNQHDFMDDFMLEIPMYQHSGKIVEIVRNSISPEHEITDNLSAAYDALLKKSIVTDKEMVSLDAWLKDLKNLA